MSDPGDEPLVTRLMSIDEAAELLRVSRSLLAKWRMTGVGPRFAKVGRRILYDTDDISRWLDRQ